MYEHILEKRIDWKKIKATIFIGMALSSRYTYIQYTVHSSVVLGCIPFLITIKLNILLIIDFIPHIWNNSQCIKYK